MRWILFSLCVLSAGALAQPEECASWFSRLRNRLPAIEKRQTRTWEETTYEKAKTQLRGTDLSEALAQGTLDSPEKLFAVLDSLVSKTENTFSHQIRELEAGDVVVHFKSYRMPFGWASRRQSETGEVSPKAPTSRARRGWPGLRKSWKFIGRKRHLTIRFPTKAPRTPEQLMDLAYQYSTMLSFYRVDRATERAPLLSLPLGPKNLSYPKQALAVLHEVEAHLFETLSALEARFPGTRLPLQKRDRVWRPQAVQLTWELASRVIFPSYAPLGPYRATFDRYAEYLNHEAHRSDSKYRRRLALHWAVSRWREVFMAVILVNVWDVLAHLHEDIAKVRDVQDEVERMKTKYTPDNLNRAMDEYHGEGEGFDLVLDFYNKQIAKLEAKRDAEGDPDGTITKQIEELKERRDFLAY